MAVDIPAKIAVLGAGPIGLEAALYARYLGYDVELFERGEVGEHVRRWGHVRMFTPFALNRSPLGLAALAAQDEAYRPPGDDELLTGGEWLARYLHPLSQSDLLADHLRLGCRVAAVGREEHRKTDLAGDERADDRFRILYLDRDGREQTADADVVIDATGVFSQPGWLGPGGCPARGELALRDRIEYGLPDVLGVDRPRYADRHTLVVGAGYSAATTIVALAELAATAPDTRVTWIVRRPRGAQGPIGRIDNDRLNDRDRLAQAANELAQARGVVTLVDAAWVDALEPAGAGLAVALVGAAPGRIDCDEVVANIGYRPDLSLFAELHAQTCYATDGPLQLAASLLKANSRDCLAAPAGAAELLVHPEPHFYVLGAKSYGRNSQFLFAQGLAQIRALFTVIGDRSTLDLYANCRRLAGLPETDE